MDSHNLMYLEQQERTANLRRQQEQQRREEERERQLLEDEEREQRADQGPRAPASSEESPESPEPTAQRPKASLWTWFGKRPKNMDDDEEADDDQDDAPAGERAKHEPVKHVEGGAGVVPWLIGLAIAAVLGFFGWQSFRSSPAPAMKSVESSKPATELPLARPEEGLSTPSGAQAGVEPAEPVASVTPAATSATNLAPEHERSHMADPASSEAPSAAAAVAVAHETPAAPIAAPAPSEEAPQPGEPTETERLRVRVAELEASVARLLAAEPRPRAPVPHTPRPQAVNASTKAIPAAPKAAPVVSPAFPPGLEPVLLAIDVWDGKPSVVMGTSGAGDRRTVVLQPGDSLNGVQLRSVDAAAGKATFAVGDGAPMTLRLANTNPSGSDAP
ncbi:MAG: hypothetical protein KA222_00185 [Pseudoxanthomonas sp.]|jgi:hypothetical protein|nr:hypothetical protein [Pseudoxanthomonas sp.]HRL52880.1 hypothetical protein [Acidovorax temperans]